MRRILLTGTTSTNAIPDYHRTRSQIGMIPVNEGFLRFFKENMDCSVEWRPVIWGENLDRYDLILNTIISPSNMTAGSCYAGSLWALRYEQCKVYLDDWQATGVYSYAKKRKKGDSYRRAGLERFQSQFMSVPGDEMCVYEQTEAEWITEKQIMMPLYDGGNPYVVLPDHPREKLHWINPNWFLPLKTPVITPFEEKKYEWITAALSKGHRDRIDHRSLSPTLPVWKLGKRLKDDPMTLRMHEDDAINFFSEKWFNLSVAYHHTKKGSGWWRFRYQQVTDGLSIIVCESKEEASILGPSFVTASEEWSLLENASVKQLSELALAQREDFRVHKEPNLDKTAERLQGWIDGKDFGKHS